MLQLDDEVLQRVRGGPVAVVAAQVGAYTVGLSGAPFQYDASAEDDTADIADALDMPAVVVPARAGVRFARELGVPLHEVVGSGPKGRITQDDIQNFVKGVMGGAVQTAAQKAKAPAAAPAAAGGA